MSLMRRIPSVKVYPWSRWRISWGDCLESSLKNDSSGCSVASSCNAALSRSIIWASAHTGSWDSSAASRSKGRFSLFCPSVTSTHLERVSALPFSEPDRWWISKLKAERNSDHRAWRRFNCFVVRKYSKFLWSENTRVWCGDPSKYTRQSWNAKIILRSSLS